METSILPLKTRHPLAALCKTQVMVFEGIVHNGHVKWEH